MTSPRPHLEILGGGVCIIGGLLRWADEHRCPRVTESLGHMAGCSWARAILLRMRQPAEEVTWPVNGPRIRVAVTYKTQGGERARDWNLSLAEVPGQMPTICNSIIIIIRRIIMIKKYGTLLSQLNGVESLHAVETRVLFLETSFLCMWFLGSHVLGSGRPEPNPAFGSEWVP